MKIQLGDNLTITDNQQNKYTVTYHSDKRIELTPFNIRHKNISIAIDSQQSEEPEETYFISRTIPVAKEVKKDKVKKPAAKKVVKKAPVKKTVKKSAKK